MALDAKCSRCGRLNNQLYEPPNGSFGECPVVCWTCLRPSERPAARQVHNRPLGDVKASP